jgi:RNA polymerase sigma-70 factor (ECF subfamily)
MPDTRTRQVQVTRLLMRHRTALYGYILACVRNHSDAEDVFQEVAVAVTQSIDALQEEQGFLAWAREIARRRVLTHFREAERERPCDPELVRRLAEAAERAEQARPASERHAALLACLEALPQRSRRLIRMRYDGSAPHVADLARMFGGTVQAIYAQLKRVKQGLRGCVERRLARELES